MNIRKALSILLCVSMIALTACNKSTDTTKEQITQDVAVPTTEETTATLSTVGALTGDYSEEEIAASWEEASATKISFNNNTLQIDGTGAQSSNNIVTISQAGTYVVNGTLADGQILVDAGDNDNVQIVLNNATLTSNTSSPLYIINAKNVYLTLADGTINAITDAAEYIYENTEEDRPNAAIFSMADLIINGSGTLNVTGNYNNGIRSKDDLKIVDGTLVVTSVDDGIVGKDSVTIRTGNITVISQGDAIKSTNSEDTSKGYIIVDGGNFTITSATDGILAETTLIVNAGTFDVTTTGDITAVSAKAFKAGAVLTLNDGVYHINSSDDSIHSNGTITIAGGNYDMNSGDDGIHADSTITIEDGTILITKSYEGIESEYITINGGTITVTASDDGINISGGNDSSSTNGRPGENGFASSGDGVLTINNGTITVDAKGDGLDANGSIAINGGTTFVTGPTDSGNGVLDYDQTFNISGGILLAAGSTGMAMTPSDTSTQPSVVMVYDTVQSSGTIIHLEDDTGNEIATFSPFNDYQFVIISTPDLINGSTYNLYADGTYSTQSIANVYSGGSYTNGSLVHTFTVSEIINANQEITSNGGFGGGQGGMGDQEGKVGGPMGDQTGERPERPERQGADGFNDNGETTTPPEGTAD